jgi:hypothetical protein
MGPSNGTSDPAGLVGNSYVVGQLQASGQTSGNYNINYVVGDYKILPADVLLVRANNLSEVYGTGTPYSIASAEYQQAGTGYLTLTGSGTNNNFSYTDGTTNGNVNFTLTPTSGAYSTSGNLAVGNYAVGATSIVKGTNFTDFVVVGNHSVTQKSLTPSATAGVSKTYDGTTNMTGLALGTSGSMAGDLVAASGTGAFASKNAGTNLSYSVTSLALSGADAGNYYLSGGGTLSGTNGTITPAALTLAAATDSKTYDGTTNSSGVVTSTGLVAGDSLSGASQSFASKNVLGTNGSTLQVNGGYTVSDGNGGANYTVSTSTASGTITPKALTVSGITASNKVYDGTTAATVNTGAASLSGLVVGDMVNVSASGAFGDKNVGTAKTVTLSSGYSGADVGNYAITSQGTTSADITAKAITVSATGTNRVYDGTVNDAVSLASAGVLASDVVSFANTAATFADKNVGTAKTVSVSGISASGTDAGNYSLSNTTASTIANITVKSLSVTGETAANKVYDTTTTATLTGGTLSGVIAGDTVTLTQTGSFASKNVGTGIVVTAADTLGGTDAGNYTLVQPTGLSANIVPAILTVTANDSAKIVTTSDPNFASTSDVSYSGFLNGETASVVGGALSITRSNTAIQSAGTYNGVLVPSGLSASNYAINYVNGNFTIVPASQLLITANNVSSVYGGAAALSVGSVQYLNSSNSVIYTLTQISASGSTSTYSDGVGGTVSFALGASGPLSTGGSLVVGNYAVTGSGVTQAGGNFSGGPVYVGVQTVTPKALNVTGVTAANKVYDATTAATLGGGTVTALGSDAVTLSTAGASGSFASKNVGASIAVTASGYTISGADAGNYTLGQPTGLSANITPAMLNVTGVTAANKVYDTTTTATLTGGTLSGVIAGDTVTLTQTGSFASKNAGTGIVVTATDTLGGTDAGNYTLVQPSGLSANITPAMLNVTGVTAANKVYDTTTTATLTGGTVTALGSDAVTLSTAGASGSFASKNVGASIAVTASGYTISGADAGNYSLGQPTGLTSSIASRAITIAAPDNVTKTFDGNTSVPSSYAPVIVSGGVGEGILSNSLAYTSPDAGTGKQVIVSNVVMNDGNGGNNYNVTYVDSTSGVINVSATPVSPIPSLTTTTIVPYITASEIGMGTSISTGTLIETSAFGASVGSRSTPSDGMLAMENSSGAGKPQEAGGLGEAQLAGFERLPIQQVLVEIPSEAPLHNTINLIETLRPYKREVETILQVLSADGNSLPPQVGYDIQSGLLKFSKVQEISMLQILALDHLGKPMRLLMFLTLSVANGGRR